MRWLSLVSFTLLAACGASEVQSQKLKDGSWSFTCELAMDECIRRVQEQCRNQRYRILEGTSETRLRDAPPFERAYHTSRLHLVCNDDGANVLLSLGGGSEQGAPKPTIACSVGETRACIGPGACKGGQVCLPDGKGFGSCDCGPNATPPASTPAEPVVPPPDVTPDGAPGSMPPTAPPAP
jgi:hypothetical protein